MLKYFAAGTFVVATAAVVISFTVHPTAFLQQVSLVFWVWFVSGLANNVGVVAMAALCGLRVRQLANHENKYRAAVAEGMQSRYFWPLFWSTLGCLVINSLVPFTLFGTLPWLVVLGIGVLNLAGSSFAIPVRVWVWGIRRSPPAAGADRAGIGRSAPVRMDDRAQGRGQNVTEA
jgi:hypothetical protein